MYLSTHFSLAEMTRSEYAMRHGIPNTPPDAVLENLRSLCIQVMERVRAYIAHDRPIRITSGYRSPRVNAGIGGANTSQHLHGEAADFEIPGMSHRQVVEAIARHMAIPFDQLIYEGGEEGWVHISHKRSGMNRREVLAAVFVEGRAQYTTMLV